MLCIEGKIVHIILCNWMTTCLVRGRFCPIKPGLIIISQASWTCSWTMNDAREQPRNFFGRFLWEPGNKYFTKWIISMNSTLFENFSKLIYKPIQPYLDEARYDLKILPKQTASWVAGSSEFLPPNVHIFPFEFSKFSFTQVMWLIIVRTSLAFSRNFRYTRQFHHGDTIPF